MKIYVTNYTAVEQKYGRFDEEYVFLLTVLTLMIFPSSAYPTTGVAKSLIPIRLPTLLQSSYGTPIAKEMGNKA